MERLTVAELPMTYRIILVTGGARSGKSKYAEQRAEELGRRRIYVATAEAKDEEMTERIAAHKKNRGNAWITVEEPVNLAEALLAWRGRTDCALVDCLTIWTSNLLIARDENYIEEKIGELLQTLADLDFHLIFVTNELGCGIVPENPLARRFRDLMGRTNQRIAQAADEVIVMIAGLPMIVKKDPMCS
jgi:adenosylcobinamide kinase/adenosylcobinamide-phosphate guanylyltransferase